MFDIREKCISCYFNDIEKCQKLIFDNFSNIIWDLEGGKKIYKKEDLITMKKYFIHCSMNNIIIFSLFPNNNENTITYKTLKKLLRKQKLERILS